MKFSKSSLPLMLAILAASLIAGCATQPKEERRLQMPSWFDLRDEDQPKDDKEASVDYSAESAADASDRITQEEQKPAKSASLFDVFKSRFGQGKTEKPEKADDTTKQAQTSDSEAASIPSTEPATTPDTLVTQPEQPKKHSQEQPAVVEAPKVVPQPKALVAKSQLQAKQAQQAKDTYNAALNLLKAGSLDDALQLFQEISQQFPTLTGPLVNQAIILRKQGKLENAKSILQTALLNKAQNPYLMNELGIIYRALGKFEAAKQSYLSAIRIEPNYDKAHYNLAVLADLYLHDPVLAAAEFEAYQALQETPNKKVAGWLKEIKRRIK